MDIGKLKKKVVFYFNIPQAKGAGFVDTYFELLTTKGYLRKKSGSQGLSFGEAVVSSSYELWVRYQSYLENHLRGDLKIKIDDVNYKIEDWEKVEEKDFYYKLIINGDRN